MSLLSAILDIKLLKPFIYKNLPLYCIITVLLKMSDFENCIQKKHTTCRYILIKEMTKNLKSIKHTKSRMHIHMYIMAIYNSDVSSVHLTCDI